MTTRALSALPEEWAGPIMDLLTRARTAAAPGGDDSAWITAEAGQTRVRTGFKAFRRTASAGQYGAHVLRLLARDRIDRGATDTPTLALARAGAAINSWDWDERLHTVLALRATFKDLPADELTTATMHARLVSTWLTHNDGDKLVSATARLATYVLEHTPLTGPLLAGAWYSTHGTRLLVELASRGTPLAGHPTTEAAQHHTLLRTAVRGIWATGLHTKTDLAQRAGITRMTLDAWLKETPDA